MREKGFKRAGWYSLLLVAVASVISLTEIGFAAERWTLRHGGRITGNAATPTSASSSTEAPREPAAGVRTIEPHPGIKVTLASQAISNREVLSSAIAEYERIAPTFADTVEAQWELVRWCEKQKLKEQRDIHLRRIVRLDSQQSEAWKQLGYEWFNGEWLMQSDRQAKEGYTLYKGRYRTEAEIIRFKKLEEDRKNSKKQVQARQQQARDQWMRKLAQWRSQFVSLKGDSVREEVLAIDDPWALSSLREMLLKESLFPVKQLWLQAIEEMAKREGVTGERALHTLAMLSLESLDESTHAEIVSFLQERQSPELIEYYVQILMAVNNKQPQELSAIAVDRVQIVLRKFRLENVIPPLVKQLKIIKHVAVVSKGADGRVSQATLSTSGEAVRGNESPYEAPEVMITRHTAILDALQAITGQNFGYDERRWTDWYQRQLANAGSSGSRP